MRRRRERKNLARIGFDEVVALNQRDAGRPDVDLLVVRRAGAVASRNDLGRDEGRRADHRRQRRLARQRRLQNEFARDNEHMLTCCWPETPKSASFGTPSSLSKRLSAFTSR